jgi:hypothetical protein
MSDYGTPRPTDGGGKRMTTSYPIAPNLKRKMNGRYGARRPVPASRSERPLSDQKGDPGRNPEQRARSVDSGPSRSRPGTGKFDPKRKFTLPPLSARRRARYDGEQRWRQGSETEVCVMTSSHRRARCLLALGADCRRSVDPDQRTHIPRYIGI